jgi:hypothetical protein
LANELNPDVLQRLARLGAQARLDQIDMERLAILEAFPDLGAPKRPAAGRAKPAVVVAKAAPARRRPKMTAAQRKAVSERMTKFWAERRKAKEK